MQLITTAHLGEAQPIIEVFQLNQINAQLYSNDKFSLLITGEGPIEALTKTALTIPTLEVSEIINIGTAGALSDKLNVGDIVQVRTVYLVQDQKPQFKTFQSFSEGYDCITSFERILDPLKAKKLKGIGHLVDREAWGIAMAAKSSGIPFKSLKVISDIAGSSEACELVREKALELGEKILEMCIQKINLTPEPFFVSELQGIHFTFTSRHRFMSLLHKLCLKKNLSEDELFRQLPLDDIKAMQSSSKNKANHLINYMEDQLDPKRKHINSRLISIIKNFEKEGFRLQTDPQLEKPKAIISFEAENDFELKKKVQSLGFLSLQDFSAIMNGELDVE